MAHQQPYPQPGFNIPPPQYNPSYVPNSPMRAVPTVVTFGESSVRMTCPNCHSEILTRTSEEFSLPQHIAFFVMCITGICLICSCVPYCVSSLSNVKHYCPQCQLHLGTYKR